MLYLRLLSPNLPVWFKFVLLSWVLVGLLLNSIAFRHRVHELHHVAYLLNVQCILKLFHLCHLRDYLAEVVALFNVVVHVELLLDRVGVSS